MPKFLSQEWHEATLKMAESQPERPGASARMQYVVSGGPDGDIRYYWLLEEGKLLEAQLGDMEDAEITLTQSYDDAASIQKGELDATAAFMQGRVKVTGNMAKLMSLLPLTNSPEYKQLQDEIRQITEYSSAAMGTIRQRLLATAVLIALGASACSGGGDKKAAPAGDKKPAPFEAKVGGARSPAAGLRADLTHQLQEHVYLSGLTTTLVLQGADPTPAASVLEANTAALGETFATLYDEETALKFLELWRKKTDLFVRFAQATLAADQAALADVKTQLVSYSTDFATFLNGVNPQLPAEGLTTDAGAHVNAVLSAITAQSKNDPLALEKLKDAAAVMPRTSAIYAAGIVKQMTPSFGGTADGGGATLLATFTAALQENVYLLAATTRVVVTGADEKKSRETLDENSEGLANLFAGIYGDADGRRFLRVWRTHVSAVVEAAEAAKAADAAALRKATADLARFRTQLGGLLASLNPSLPGRAVAADFEDYVAGLLAVVAAQAAADPAEFQRLHEAAATTPLLAELLAGAIAQQFATKFT